MNWRKYQKKSDQTVVAVQINLQTDGFAYRKWGHDQQCKAGDWLVDNQGDCYTVNEASFATTYRYVSPGIYLKVAPVWARVVDRSDKIRTKEGYSDYRPGDYLVANDADGSDAYAVAKADFEAMYEPVSRRLEPDNEVCQPDKQGN